MINNMTPAFRILVGIGNRIALVGAIFHDKLFHVIEKMKIYTQLDFAD